MKILNNWYPMSIIKKTTKYKYMHKKLDKLRYMI